MYNIRTWVCISFSLFQHGGSWRRRSLIEDAKFETVTNLEFEKRERTLSQRNSISEEEEEVFVQNGECLSPVDKEPEHIVVLILTIKDGIASLSRILRIFEVCTLFFLPFLSILGVICLVIFKLKHLLSFCLINFMEVKSTPNEHIFVPW